MSFAIRVENLGKRYELGATHAGSVRELVNRTWSRMLGRTDAALPPRTPIPIPGERIEDNSFWALRDVSLQIKPGEVVGIIGHNGSGKSTLLKILSQITAPTTGRVELRGRVASLLEVGTGFHRELSGRENIFLNGAILGMTKPEIRRNFDEIVAFAEIEKFLDTPVKRYSSGMYVRLAFAVAAHLEPEILIVDEVLAVGDADFQKKCIGKMSEVAGRGRTILFVSHSMPAIRKLCGCAILLNAGRVEFAGEMEAAILRYFGEFKLRQKVTQFKYTYKDDTLDLREASMPSTRLEFGAPLKLRTTWFSSIKQRVGIEVVLRDQTFHPLSFFGTGMSEGYELILSVGENIIDIEFESLPLAEGRYYLDLATAKTNKAYLSYAENALAIEIESSDPLSSGQRFIQGNGAVYIPCRVTSHQPRVSIVA